MPCPHFDVKVIQRSKRQSAVASAAYQSGERLFCEYDQKTEILQHRKRNRPRRNHAAAPRPAGVCRPEYLVERRRSHGKTMELPACPKVRACHTEWKSPESQRYAVHDKGLLCREFFVSKGMIADFAIHDKGDGNPTRPHSADAPGNGRTRQMASKSRKVYDLDENGERIRLPSGNWKSHKENTVDWNDQKYAEIWRHGWETITNRYLEAAGRPERVDLRSFERQGIQQIPTVHLGPAAHQMEKRGVETFLGNLNRDIKPPTADAVHPSDGTQLKGLAGRPEGEKGGAAGSLAGRRKNPPCRSCWAGIWINAGRNVPAGLPRGS